VGGVGAEQKTLDDAAGGALGVEAGGEDGGVVAKQGVARLEKLWEVGEDVVGYGARDAVHDHETGGITARGRGLRDEERRQVIVEEISGERHGGDESGK
jgi:hypothetical protein